MKSVLLVLSFILASQSQAAPEVGDSATYSYTQTGLTSALTVSQTITAIDKDTQVATIQETTTLSGTVLNTESHDMPAADLNYPSDDMIAQCALNNSDDTSATLETFTNGAGTFISCHLVSKKPDAQGNLSDFHMAAIPFGILKATQIAADHTVVAMELLSFVKGN